MATRNHAVVDWTERFENKDVFPASIYTVQVEDALMGSDSQPILFFGFVSDITRQGTKYYAHFEALSGFNVHMDIRFVLECDLDQVKIIMKQKADMFEKYAVVAQVSSVQRPEFDVKAQPESNEEAHIAVESSDIFMAKGRCLDLLFVGDYEERKE